MTRWMGWRALPVVLAVSLCFVAPRAHAEDSASAADQAHRHFKVGISYLQDPEGERYEEAYGEFKLAYELSHSSKVLGNIGLCAMKLERDGEAINAYTRYLAEVPDIEGDERAQIERDLAAMQASAVHVTVELHQTEGTLADTRTNAQGGKVHNNYSPTIGKTELVVRSGHHVMALRSAGKDLATWEYTAEPGAKLSHDFVPAPTPPPGALTRPARPPRSRTVPIIVTGIGAATLAAGGVLGALTLDKLHKLEKKCPNNACPSDSYTSDVGSVRKYVRATDIVLLSGGVLTLTGLTWYFIAGASDAPEQQGKKNSTHFDAMCTGQGCAGSLQVAF